MTLTAFINPVVPLNLLFPLQKVIWPQSRQSSKYRTVTHNFTNDDLTNGKSPSYHNSTLSVAGSSLQRFPQAPPSPPSLRLFSQGSRWGLPQKSTQPPLATIPSLPPHTELLFWRTVPGAAPQWLSSSSSFLSSSSLRCSLTSSRLLSLGRGGVLIDLCHPATHQMSKIQRLGFELPTMTAIQTTGHTYEW